MTKNKKTNFFFWPKWEKGKGIKGFERTNKITKSDGFIL